jgi:hypothetical protein
MRKGQDSSSIKLRRRRLTEHGSDGFAGPSRRKKLCGGEPRGGPPAAQVKELA